MRDNTSKDRGKRFLNAKKPTFWLVMIMITALIMAGAGLLANPRIFPRPTAISTAVTSTSAEISTSIYTDETTSSGLKIVGSISDELLVSLGTGIQADAFFAKAGQPSDIPPDGRYVYRSGDSADILIMIQVVEHNGANIIRSADIAAAGEGKFLFGPTPDPGNIDDFQIVANGQTVRMSGVSISSLLDIFGEPQTTETTIESNSDDQGTYQIRKMIYDRMEITLFRLEGSVNPDGIWAISQVIWRDPSYATPRGLKPGMSYPDVLQMLGTGDFNLYPDDLPEPSHVEVSKLDTVNDGEYYQIDLLFEQGYLSSVSMTFTGP